MLLRFGLQRPEAADVLERAVDSVLAAGCRTADLIGEAGLADGCTQLGCSAIGDRLLQAL
jgi:3-isopropylmalate dehydrogenase